MYAILTWATLALALGSFAGAANTGCPECDCCGCCEKGTCTCDNCTCCCCDDGVCEGCCK